MSWVFARPVLRTLYNNYVLFYSGGVSRIHRVGIILSPELADKVDSASFKSERVLNLTLKLRSRNIGIVQIYASQQVRPNHEKEAFYSEIKGVVDMSKYRDNLIVLGDWNGNVGINRLGVENVLGSFGVGEGNAEGSRILDFCLSQKLAIAHSSSHKWTWYWYVSGRQRYAEHSAIDLVATDNKKIIRDIKAISLVSVDTDHWLVVAKINVGSSRKRAKRKMKRINIEKVKDEEKSKMERGWGGGMSEPPPPQGSTTTTAKDDCWRTIGNMSWNKVGGR